MTCSDACRRADRADDSRTRRAIASAEAVPALPTQPRDPANALRDAALALHSVDDLARRVCRLAYGFEGDVLHFDDEIAAQLNADPAVPKHYDAARVARVRLLALARMRQALELAPALPGPLREAPHDPLAPLGVTRRPSGRHTPTTAYDLVLAAHEDAGAPTPLPFVEVEVTAAGTQWADVDVIGRDRDPAAEWLLATHGAAALDGFPLAHRAA